MKSRGHLNGIHTAMLKLICEMSLYCAVSGFFLALLESTHNIFLPMLEIVVMSALSYMLRDMKAVRFLPHLPGIYMFYLIICGDEPVNTVWVLPIYIYSIVVTAKKLYNCDRRWFIMLYKYAVWIVAVFGLAGSAFSARLGGDNGSGAFAIVFMVSGMLLLRYARQSPVLVKDAYFNAVNIGSAAFVAVGGIAIAFIIKYSYLLICKLLGWLLSLKEPTGHIGNYIEITPSPTPEGNWTLDDAPYTTAPPVTTGKGDYKPAIGILILIALLAVALFAVLRIRKKNAEEADSAGDIRTRIKKDSKKESGSKIRALGNRNAVRRCYRRFMQLCLKKKIAISKSMTAREITDSAKKIGFLPDECDSLMRIYLLARYSQSAVSDDDARLANRLLRRIKAAK